MNEPASDTLQEVKMKLLEPQACKHFTSFRHNSPLCVGNPKKMQNVYKVSLLPGFPKSTPGSQSSRSGVGQKIVS